MENPFFHRLGRALWIGIVILVVILAIYVSAGRVLAANLAVWRTEILQELNARVPFTVEAQKVAGEWQSFTPVIVLTGLRLSFPGSSNPPLLLSEGRIGVDVLNSLRTRALQMTRLELYELSLRGELSSDGVLRLTGFGGSEEETSEQLREFLLNVERIALRNNRLILTLPSGEVRDLDLNLQLSRDGSQRRVQAQLSSTRGERIFVLAEGVGDPFRPEFFSGQVYVDIQSTDLGAARDLLPHQSLPLWAGGALDLKMWLDWDRGDPSVAARLEGHDVRLAGQDSSWEVPLDRIALQAHLRKRTNRWTLFVSDLQVAKDDVEVTVPRLQLDTWDNALRIRASDVPLEATNDLITDLEAVPKRLREVFVALHPRGRLSSLQVSIGDLEQPVGVWEVEANFDAVAVDSFIGAPGATSITGYTRIAPGGGVVVLDSQFLTLDFPSVYHEPLRFDDLYGTLQVEWDAETFSLASGLLTTHGEEGAAKVLFGLQVPLVPSDIGIEMDLLVGLQNLHATHRGKYVPYVLDTSLLTWLSDSIGEGRIAQGAFLWRGTLRKDSAPLRTVQLAFNVADTHMQYHPRWPPVVVQEGIVLIDDSEVSVWAENASLFESAVEQLSVETRLNNAGQITLDLKGRVQGPAADGLKVLNESALSGVVGPTFATWTASGKLDTKVELHLNLSDQSLAPRVDVATRWQDVDLLIMPGNLAVQAVNGEFNYSSALGFSSRALEGELWGKAVSASLEQAHRAGSETYDPVTSDVNVELVAQVDMVDLRRWLQLETLAFVSGQTTAAVDIRLSPGDPPQLSVSSELEGVSLDLPQPWGKKADEAHHLQLEMPLVQGSKPLSLSLGEQLSFRLDIANGAVRGGSLGVNAEPLPSREGVLRVTGRTPLIQGDQWLDFVTRYFDVDDQPVQAQSHQDVPPVADVATGETPGTGSEGHTEAAQPLPLKILIDEVQADTLVILAQELRDVAISLAVEPAHWGLSLHTDWLRGGLHFARDGSPSQVNIGYLDINKLPEFKLPGGGGESTWDVPVVDVTLSNLFQSEQRLGELNFKLKGEGGVLTAEKLSGELANLRLRDERPGRLAWHQGTQGHTELQASLNFEDLGQTLDYFGYERIVETQGGNFDINLRWPGAPQDYSLRNAEGSMQVAIGAGSFLEASSGASGALRVVSILNLADIVRRLSLSHMFESGIPFESVDGEVYLHEGALEVARMDVKGSSSFQFSGVSDVEAKSLSGDLVATLPVARNLPWIAALAAGLPVAAGVYLVSKVFDKEVDRLSSAVYRIGGTWNDPKVDFDRIFDNTREGATAESAAKPVAP